MRLTTVETLTLDLDEESAMKLADLDAPRLTSLHTRTPSQCEAQFIRLLTDAKWFPHLESWSHRLTSEASLAALSSSTLLVSRRGHGALFLCAEHVMRLVTDHLRETLKHARFELLPTPEQPGDPGDFHRVIGTTVVPTKAPTTFRTLAPRTETRYQIAQSSSSATTLVGSGFALPSNFFNRCGWCGSANTMGIFVDSWWLESAHERTRYHDWEYECLECRLFTVVRSGSTS